jgi:hypothetical protein
MENPRNLPFAMYDVAVYLPSGAVGLILASKVSRDLLGYAGPIDFGRMDDTAVQQVIVAIVWLSASYLTGHIIAFISSYIVEKFIHNNLGYPSEVWLKSEMSATNGKLRDEVVKLIFKENMSKARSNWVHSIILLSQLPAIVPLMIMKMLLPLGFYSTKIPFGLLGILERRFDVLKTGVKIVEHYVANNCPSGYTRMYNYLVVYGALRSIALIVLFYLWASILFTLKMIFIDNWSFSLQRTVYFTFGSFSYVLCLMAFAKFNRRYFEESVLAFLFGTSDPPSGPRAVFV